MLKPAYIYQDKLQEAYNRIIFDDRYKYYINDVYWTYKIKLSEDSWSSLEFVSVDKNKNVIGLLAASVNRQNEKIDGLRVMNFSNKDNITFSKDMYFFIVSLFMKFRFRKIEFSVVIGNPIEKMYDKYCIKYGGRICGIRKEATALQDGKFYDLKYYEIFRKDFLKCYKNGKYAGEDSAERILVPYKNDKWMQSN